VPGEDCGGGNKEKCVLGMDHGTNIQTKEDNGNDVWNHENEINVFGLGCSLCREQKMSGNEKLKAKIEAREDRYN
jgi:hypothetical protein